MLFVYLFLSDLPPQALLSLQSQFWSCHFSGVLPEVPVWRDFSSLWFSLMFNPNFESTYVDRVLVIYSRVILLLSCSYGFPYFKNDNTFCFINTFCLEINEVVNCSNFKKLYSEFSKISTNNIFFYKEKLRICKNALKERCSQHRDWDEGCFLFEVNGLILRIYTDCLFSDSVLSNCRRKLQLCLSWLSRFSLWLPWFSFNIYFSFPPLTYISLAINWNGGEKDLFFNGLE